MTDSLRTVGPRLTDGAAKDAKLLNKKCEAELRLARVHAYAQMATAGLPLDADRIDQFPATEQELEQLRSDLRWMRKKANKRKVPEGWIEIPDVEPTREHPPRVEMLETWEREPSDKQLNAIAQPIKPDDFSNLTEGAA